MFDMEIGDDESMLDTVPIESSQSALSQEPHTPPVVRADAHAHMFFPPVRSDSPYATQPQSIDAREGSPVQMAARSLSLPIINADQRHVAMRHNATATNENVRLPGDAPLQDPEEQFAMTHVSRSFRPGSSGKQ